MDVGVGSVMFSAGLTQRKIRDLVLLPPEKRKKSNICRDLLTLFYASFFIFLLAFGRFLVHRELDYHVRLNLYLPHHSGSCDRVWCALELLCNSLCSQRNPCDHIRLLPIQFTIRYCYNDYL